ncbi:uncharacterized protein LOC128625358 [Ictalurus furcatus]|uniref:uncharacterized protein LOC128625358 n=1 Tax=Ictalurus furcatus TaxID=66913 RepID=UPI0023507883|nr:uncharacterized protein LOC128625358 [Ictalurus furcatus]
MSDKHNMIHFFTSMTTSTTTTMTQASTPEEKPSADLSLVTTPPSTATEESTAASPVFSTPPITTRHTATHLSSPPTRSSTTEEKTDSALSTVSTSQTTPKDKSTASTVNTTSGPKSSERFNMTHQTDVLKRPVFVLLLSVTSVCVFLAGLMSVCLCRFIRKQTAERRKMDMACGDQGVMMSMLNMNTSGSETAGTYSVITSVPLPSLPLDTSGDVKEDAKKTGDDVYHMYCTIADTQVVTQDKDTVYSLIQKH